MTIWNSLAVEPITNGLVFFYHLTGNLGVAIILLSASINFLLFPLEFPHLKERRQRQATMRQLAPHLGELSQDARLDLLKQHNVERPLIISGCLGVGVVSIIRLSAMIALIQVFWRMPSFEPDLLRHLNEFLWSPLQFSTDESFSTRFAYLDLRDRDFWKLENFSLPMPGLLLLSAAILLFVYSYSTKVLEKRHRQAVLPILSADVQKHLGML